MYGVTLSSADLGNASFDFAELQGAEFGSAFYDGASFEGPLLWRSGSPELMVEVETRPRIREPVFEARYKPEKSDACKERRADGCAWAPEVFKALNRSLTESISDIKRRGDALERVSMLDPALPEPEPDGTAVWLALEKAQPTPAELRKTRLKRVESITCNGDASVHILHALLKRYKEVPELKDLAKQLLEEETCSVARSLSRQDRRLLEAIRSGRTADLE